LIRGERILKSDTLKEQHTPRFTAGPIRTPSSPAHAVPDRAASADRTPNVPVHTSLLNLAAALGLPRDKLSASILSFLRFFSLPLDSASAAQIRSRALDSGADPKGAELKGPDTAKATADKAAGKADSGQGAVSRGAETLLRSREALSLACAAFLDKGLQPGGEALEKYAGAIDPGRRRPPGNSAGNGGNGGEGADHGKGGDRGHSDAGSPKDRDGSGVPDGDLLRRRAAAGDPLFDLVNRLPGRSGRRWIVIPFEWEQYSVTLRILLGPDCVRPDSANAKNDRTDHIAANNMTADRMALELVSGKPEGGRWLFVFNFRNYVELNFGRCPSPGNGILDSMKKELSALLDLPFDQIHPQNWGEFPPFAPDSRDNALLSVNEEV
jgi:hypothetical protein